MPADKEFATFMIICLVRIHTGFTEPFSAYDTGSSVYIIPKLVLKKLTMKKIVGFRLTPETLFFGVISTRILVHFGLKIKVIFLKAAIFILIITAYTLIKLTLAQSIADAVQYAVKVSLNLVDCNIFRKEFNFDPIPNDPYNSVQLRASS